jgi:hypothetical protein
VIFAPEVGSNSLDSPSARLTRPHETPPSASDNECESTVDSETTAMVASAIQVGTRRSNQVAIFFSSG